MLRLFLSVGLASVVSSSDLSIDLDEQVSLLQFGAVRHNHSQSVASESSQAASVASESSQAALNAFCEFAGDVHIMKSFYGGTVDHHKNGLFEVVNSIDGRFNVQTYQCPATKLDTANGWLNAFAFELDGTKIVVLPPSRDEIHQAWVRNGNKWVLNNEDWQGGELRKIYIYADGVQYDATDLPVTIPGTSIEIRKHRYDFEFEIVTDGFRARILQTCFSHMGPYCYYSFGVWLDSSNVPARAESNSMCTTAQDSTQLAADKPIIFSNDDLKFICDFCMDGIENWKSGEGAWKRNGAESNLDNFKCAMPPDPPPPPPAKQTCEDNKCSWDHGMELCSSLEGDSSLYNDCLFDFCQQCEDLVADEMVEFEEDMHPKPICVQGATECIPDEVCSKSLKMNTLTVTQNNLGGVGPDEGAEEIRYGNAAVVNGRAVDLVLTTDAFTTSKPSKNGKSGAFGIINVKCGHSITLKMRVVDSESGDPVTLQRVALTWYDLDEGKKAKGRATVATCGSTGAIVSDNSELTVERRGACSTATSSVAGTGKDNPKSPHQLDSLQISRSLTLPFVGVSEWTSTLSLAKGHKGRNFLFAIEPSVACGPDEE